MEKQLYPYTLRRKVIYKGQMATKGQIWLVVKGKTNGRTLEAAKMIKGGTAPAIEREVGNYLWLKCIEKTVDKYQTPERLKKLKDYFRRYKFKWLNSTWVGNDIELWPSCKIHTRLIIDTGDFSRMRVTMLALCWLKFGIVLHYTKRTKV